MSKSTSSALVHGIDLRAPGGIEQLLAFHRCTFGDAVMSANSDGGAGTSGASGAGGESGQSGQGQGDPAGQSGASGEAGKEAQGKDDDEQLGEPGKKALLAERAANKQLKDDLAAKEQRLRELEDKDKSEEQRRDERLQELEKDTSAKDQRIQDLETLTLKYQVAATKGLDLSAAERLHGASKEEIEQDADDWISKWGTGGGKRNVPDPGQGGRQEQSEDPWQLGRDRAAKRFGSDKNN